MATAIAEGDRTLMATLERIKRELLDEAGPRPVLLLGAGASVKSGVPSAAGFTEMIARWAFLRDQGRSEHDQTVLRSDWLPWLKTLDWYDPARRPDDQYPEFVENLLVPREARMQFLLERVRAAPQPSAGYTALADLVAKGWIRTILTTNFDDLIERSCSANTRALLGTIRSPSEARNISTAPRFAQLVYLHGTVEHYTDLNLVSETGNLTAAWVAPLTPVLRDSPLVVLGYRGAEASIMSDLLIGQVEACNGFRHGIYWCTRRESQLAPLVETLRDRIGSNFLRIDIDGFDEVMVHLAFGAGTSVRALTVVEDAVLPSEELRPGGESLDELDWAQVRSWIPVCAERLEISSPGSDVSLESLLETLNLAVSVDAVTRPTVAGVRLFGAATEIEVDLVWASGERRFHGNIVSLIEQVRDALAELNPPYRLKGPKSVDVRAFEPLALKELLVNALVHRDYEAAGPVGIVLSDDQISFTSPGGVISTVDPERLGRTGAKGYRNQVIANVLFGTGDMDKLGSGLIDVRRWAQEAGADAEFRVSERNDQFRARLLARPERPPAPGMAAEATGSYEIFYANALPVRIQRGVVDVAPTAFKDRRDVWMRNPEVSTGPFLLRGGQMITLEDLRDPANAALGTSCLGPPESFDVADYSEDPERERHVVQLLNESFGRHTRELGLQVDWAQHRVWYPRSDGGDGSVQVSYLGRVKHSTRTVVKVRRSTEGEVIYFEHSALSWQFRRVGQEWYLFLLPGWAFTEDGVEKHLSPRRVTSLSTRRAARDYNANVSAHLFFWAHVLTGGSGEAILQDGGGAVALSGEPLTAHMAGMPATPGTGDPSDDPFRYLEDGDETDYCDEEADD